MDDLVLEFVAETLESLSLLDQELVRFEQTPGDKEILGNVFRMMHTIKGTCGFLGLPRLEKVAHAGEDVLGKFRDGGLVPTPGSVTLILRCIDQIRAIVEHISAFGNEGDGDDTALIDELKAAAAGSAPAPAPVPVAAAAPAASGPVMGPGGFPVAADLLEEFAQIQQAEKPAPAPAAPVRLVAVQSEPQPEPKVELKPENRAESKVDAKPAGKDKAVPQTIRVNVDVLENLMTLVSEMVLTRNQLLQLTRVASDSVFKEPIERLSRTTSELQEGVMKTRMQPIGNAWGKLPRIVRDLATELGKKIDLVMHGEETELDRQVLEMIQDPLTHMVRNSCDHGLETPEERAMSDKDETGVIKLSAFHEGGHIIIQITDDGRGINTAKVRAKIVERGLATTDEVAAMDDNLVNQYIMRAGFSTAEKVTKVSGRGVGMDVVRSNIERIGGTLEFSSVFGRGSAFTIKIPLTLAIISALVVTCGQERFALPQIAVSEVVRMSARSEHRIETLNGAAVLRLRDRLLPLVNLSSTLKLNDPTDEPIKGYVVVCRSGSQSLGVMVDTIADTEEIVVKPLSPILGATRYFSGNTILGDGRVVLILDINGLATTLAPEATAAADERDAKANAIAKQRILLFRTQSEGVKAVALSQVHRIENLDMTETEMVQGDHVIQYRDHLLPLLSFDGAGGIHRDGRQRVLVFGAGEDAIGLAIESIIDIAEDALTIRKPSQQPGILGSGIISGCAADIVEPAHFLRQGHGAPVALSAAA